MTKITNHLGLFFSLACVTTISMLTRRESGGGLLNDFLLVIANYLFLIFLLIVFWLIGNRLFKKQSATRNQILFTIILLIISIGLPFSVFMSLSDLQYLLFNSFASLPFIFVCALSGSLLSLGKSRKLPVLYVLATLPVMWLGLQLTPVDRPLYASGETTHFNKIIYGSATPQRQQQYISPDWKTQTINLDSLLPPLLPEKRHNRNTFWQFSATQFPLNAQVWLPTNIPQKAPLMVIMHGDHFMEEYSEAGYGYLGTFLAKQGIITVSIDANALNWAADGNYWWTETPARTWLILKHLQQWRTWSQDPQHAMFNKIDWQDITLLGHSRGGEAISLAALINQTRKFPKHDEIKLPEKFNIKNLISLAPVDNKVNVLLDIPPITLKNINFLLLQGGMDAEIPRSEKHHQYQRVNFNQLQPLYEKARIFIHKANHGQFNTNWSMRELVPPLSWLYNWSDALSAEQQQSLTQEFVLQFLLGNIQQHLSISEHKISTQYENNQIEQEGSEQTLHAKPLKPLFENELLNAIY
jgi:hypothetical protein